MSDSNNRGNNEQNPSEEKSDDVDSKNNNRRSIPPVNEDFLKLMSMIMYPQGLNIWLGC